MSRHLRPGGRALMAQRPCAADAEPLVWSASIPPTGCRWIGGDPREPGWTWCDAPQRLGSAYCPDHHTLCHRQPEAETDTQAPEAEPHS